MAPFYEGSKTVRLIEADSRTVVAEAGDEEMQGFTILGGVSVMCEMVTTLTV